MKYVLLSDIHLSDRPPSSCTDSYTDDLFGLLEQARQVCLSRGGPMIWAGDIFDRKAPSRTSHKLVHRVCDFIAECVRDFPVLILPGNHDIQNDRLESVMETQPLGHLYRAGATYLNGWGSPFKVFGVPWLQGYGDYWGFECDEDHPHGPEIDWRVGQALRPFREEVQAPYLVVTHAPLYPRGKELKWEHFPASRWAEGMGGKGSCFYGHVHEPHGIYQESGVTFCNHGALSRGSLHEYNLERQVAVTLWDADTGEFTPVYLDAKPASEVFRLKEKQQAVDVQGRLDDFLASAGGATLEVCSVESVIEHVKSLGLDPAVTELVGQLLEEARG